MNKKQLITKAVELCYDINEVTALKADISVFYNFIRISVEGNKTFIADPIYKQSLFTAGISCNEKRLITELEKFFSFAQNLIK